MRTGTSNYDPQLANDLSAAIVNHYDYMSPILLIPVLLIIVVALLKIPAIPSVLIVSLVGCFFAVIFQGANFSDCITTMCDQYLGLIIPASMYKDKYDEMGMGRNMLSRALEDCGTLWSPLVPWSSCGAYHSGVLGVSTFAYLPFTFMNIINPIYDDSDKRKR